jgi:hypothetical protein
MFWRRRSGGRTYFIDIQCAAQAISHAPYLLGTDPETSGYAEAFYWHKLAL